MVSIRIESYEYITTKYMENENIRLSPIIVYVRSDINYNRRIDLENKRDAVIWMKLLYKGGRKVL